MKSFRWPKDRDVALRTLAKETERFDDKEAFVAFALSHISCRSTADERDAAKQMDHLWRHVRQSGAKGLPQLAPEQVEKVFASAQQLLASGEHEQAEKMFRIVLATSGENAELAMHALVGMVYSLLNGGRHEEASTLVQSLIEMDPAAPFPQILLAKVRIAEGRYQEAEKVLRDLPQPAAQAPDTLSDLALCLTKQGRSAEAEPFARQAVEANPEDASLLVSLFGVLRDLRKFNEAEHLLPMLARLLPDDPLIGKLQAHLDALRAAGGAGEKTGATGGAG